MSTTSASRGNLLTQPLQLPSGSVLANRIAKSAMSEALGSYDNHVTAQLPRLYRRWAQGGAGLLVTGNVMVDRRALGEPGNVVLEDASDMPLLRQWAQSAGRGDTQIWMQLNHPGKQSPKGLNAYNLAPSAVPFRKEMASFFDTPRQATDAQIRAIVQRFGRSAALARQAGFDGVQIHGAHGYLVSQFLSPHHNQREDQWGGSAANRRRFVLAVLASIREQAGAGFPVGIKLNSADFQRGGFTEDESLTTIQALADAGIDLIEISGGTYETPAMTGVSDTAKKQSTIDREAYFLDFADKVRELTDTPLMVTGGFRSFTGMHAALASGALDLVGLARLLAVEPDAPAALLRGADPQHHIRPITTGIRVVDRMAIMEVQWYTRQLKRLANGKNPRPGENGFKALVGALAHSGWGTFRTRRLRA